MNTEFIELPTPGGSEFIKPEDIIAIKADDKHICLSLEEEPERNVKLSFGRAQNELGLPYLVKCHRSFIVNIFKIKGRSKNGTVLKLKNGQEIPVSKSCKKPFEEVLKIYCKKIRGVNC